MKYPALPGEMEIIIYHYYGYYYLSLHFDYVPTGRRARDRERQIEIGITFTLLIRHPNIAEEYHKQRDIKCEAKINSYRNIGVQMALVLLCCFPGL